MCGSMTKPSNREMVSRLNPEKIERPEMKTAFVRSLVIVSLFLIASAGLSRADFTFGEAQDLGIPGGTPWVMADNLELYFVADRPGGLGYFDIWVARRSSVSELWGPPANLGAPVTSQYNEAWPSLSADGLTLYFSDCFSGVNSAPDRPGGSRAAWTWSRPRQGCRRWRRA